MTFSHLIQTAVSKRALFSPNPDDCSVEHIQTQAYIRYETNKR